MRNGKRRESRSRKNGKSKKNGIHPVVLLTTKGRGHRPKCHGNNRSNRMKLESLPKTDRPRHL